MTGTRLRWRVLGAGSVAAALGYLALVDPHQAGRYPVCPFHALTGLWCPGCGGLRATHDLLHGDIAAAVGQNALLVLGVPVLALLWWWRWRPAAGRSAADRQPQAVPATLVLAVIALSFAVVRNLPVGAALAP
ncbi:MAG: DUF2752 domain-containing protein [Actinomycetes bacterium]